MSINTQFVYLQSSTSNNQSSRKNREKKKRKTRDKMSDGEDKAIKEEACRGREAGERHDHSGDVWGQHHCSNDAQDP